MKGFIFGNKIIDIVFIALVTAQVLKVLIYTIKHRKFDFKKLTATGHMPSSHSSSVVSLATSIALAEGLKSPIFAVVFTFSLVVMFDSAGVRRASGKQGLIINQLLKSLKEKSGIHIIEGQVRELLGHTPIEVFAGAVLGFVIAILLW